MNNGCQMGRRDEGIKKQKYHTIHANNKQCTKICNNQSSPRTDPLSRTGRGGNFSTVSKAFNSLFFLNLINWFRFRYVIKDNLNNLCGDTDRRRWISV